MHTTHGSVDSVRCKEKPGIDNLVVVVYIMDLVRKDSILNTWVSAEERSYWEGV